ncbi:MAG: cache domain-containing protein [Candidatus Woesearchaeota archaeon]
MRRIINFQSYRTALFFLIFVSILIPLLISSYATAKVINLKTEKLLEESLVDYGKQANSIYNNKLEQMLKTGMIIAKNKGLAAQIKENDVESLRQFLNTIIKIEEIDFALIVDRQGFVVARATTNLTGDRASIGGIIVHSLNSSLAVASTSIVSEEELSRETADLLLNARIRRIPSVTQKETPEVYETDGMVQVAVIPLQADGRIIGGVVLANLLNRDHEIPEEIKSIIDVEASIFQHDFRISTTLATEKGSRYIGTPLSENIVAKTRKGETFLGKTYTTSLSRAAYLPIMNYKGENAGVLGLEVSEERFRNSSFFFKERDFTQIMALLVLASAALSFIIAFFLSKNIVVSINKLIRSAEQVAEGNLEQGVDIKSYDEFNRLAKAFNIMIRSERRRFSRKKEQK